MNNYPPTKDQQAEFCPVHKCGESIENLQSQFPNADKNLPSNGTDPLALALWSRNVEFVAKVLKNGAEARALNLMHNKVISTYDLVSSKAIFKCLLKMVWLPMLEIDGEILAYTSVLLNSWTIACKG